MTDHTEMQIPDDIMRTATSIATALLYPEVDDDGRAYLTQEHIDIIALAILAERERAAKVCGNFLMLNSSLDVVKIVECEESIIRSVDK